MKAHANSIRIAPKKANLIAKMIRGMSVPDAMSALEHTNKKGARMLEQLLRSAIANASHNDKQDAQMMVVKTVVVNQGASYRRGVPMARGRMRPMRKFLSHITLTLGFAGDDTDAGTSAKSSKKTGSASQKAEKPVKKTSPATVSRAGTKSTKGKSPSERPSGRAGAKDTAAPASPSSK